MKRASADDSADSRVKVGHRQAIYQAQRPISKEVGRFALRRRILIVSMFNREQYPQL